VTVSLIVTFLEANTAQKIKHKQKMKRNRNQSDTKHQHNNKKRKFATTQVVKKIAKPYKKCRTAKPVTSLEKVKDALKFYRLKFGYEAPFNIMCMYFSGVLIFIIVFTPNSS
jgi:hypothetical protein